MGPVGGPAATAKAVSDAAPLSPILPAGTAPSGQPPTTAMGPDNPYTAESATQLLTFKARHPRYDGRGVTIGFVEPAARDLQTMHGALDRKRVVSGTTVAARVELGGRRSIKKQKNKTK